MKRTLGALLHEKKKNFFTLLKFFKTCQNYFREKSCHFNGYGKNNVLLRSKTPYKEIEDCYVHGYKQNEEQT